MRKEISAAALSIGLANSGAIALARETPPQKIKADTLLSCPDPNGKAEIERSLIPGNILLVGEPALILSAQSDGTISAKKIFNGSSVELYRFGESKTKDMQGAPVGTSFVEDPQYKDSAYLYGISAQPVFAGQQEISAVVVTFNIKCANNPK